MTFDDPGLTPVALECAAMNERMTLLVDADVPLVPLVEALTEVGLCLSNIPGSGSLRVHRRPGSATVTSLDDRRRRDAETDRQMREGMRALHGVPTDPDAA